MCDADYLMIPSSVRDEMELKYRLPNGEIDWSKVIDEATKRFPWVIGNYERAYFGRLSSS